MKMLRRLLTQHVLSDVGVIRTIVAGERRAVGDFAVAVADLDPPVLPSR